MDIETGEFGLGIKFPKGSFMQKNLIRIFLAILPLSVGCAGYNNPVEALFSGNNIDNNGIDRQRLLKSNAQDLECCLLQFSSQSIEKKCCCCSKSWIKS